MDEEGHSFIFSRNIFTAKAVVVSFSQNPASLSVGSGLRPRRKRKGGGQSGREREGKRDGRMKRIEFVSPDLSHNRHRTEHTPHRINRNDRPPVNFFSLSQTFKFVVQHSENASGY